MKYEKLSCLQGRNYKMTFKFLPILFSYSLLFLFFCLHVQNE